MLRFIKWEHKYAIYTIFFAIKHQIGKRKAKEYKKGRVGWGGGIKAGSAALLLRQDERLWCSTCVRSKPGHDCEPSCWWRQSLLWLCPPSWWSSWGSVRTPPGSSARLPPGAAASAPPTWPVPGGTRTSLPAPPSSQMCTGACKEDKSVEPSLQPIPSYVGGCVCVCVTDILYIFLMLLAAIKCHFINDNDGEMCTTVYMKCLHNMSSKCNLISCMCRWRIFTKGQKKLNMFMSFITAPGFLNVL